MLSPHTHTTQHNQRKSSSRICFSRAKGCEHSFCFASSAPRERAMVPMDRMVRICLISCSVLRQMLSSNYHFYHQHYYSTSTGFRFMVQLAFMAEQAAPNAISLCKNFIISTACAARLGLVTSNNNTVFLMYVDACGLATAPCSHQHRTNFSSPHI